MNRRSPEAGVTVYPLGGLGNQLFIYATGLAQASRLNCPLFIDRGWFSARTDRMFELATFRHSGQVVQGRGNDANRTSELLAKYATSQLLRNWFPRTRGIFIERSLGYDHSIGQIQPGVRLLGYFQSPRYFGQIHSLLSDETARLVTPSQWYVETRASLATLGPWISVHVRLGDYLEQRNLDTLGVVSSDFYERALELVREVTGDLPVVVFSDDPEGARSVLRFVSPGCHYVRAPKESRPVESLALMSGAAASVTANSSFSWWGAWLGPSKAKVVCPTPWFTAEKLDAKDLIPPNWTQLAR